MSKPSLIALYSSSPQMGKSTCADHLKLKHGYVRLSFAAPLKHMIRQLLLDAGLKDHECLWYMEGRGKEQDIPVIGMSAREMMQTLGTEWGRNCVRDDLWIRVAEAVYMGDQEFGLNVVNDDMRFPNEFHWVKSMGGICVRVHRPGHETQTSHSSEGGLDDMPFDYSFMDGDLEATLHGLDSIVGDR